MSAARTDAGERMAPDVAAESARELTTQGEPKMNDETVQVRDDEPQPNASGTTARRRKWDSGDYLMRGLTPRAETVTMAVRVDPRVRDLVRAQAIKDGCSMSDVVASIVLEKLQ